MAKGKQIAKAAASMAAGAITGTSPGLAKAYVKAAKKGPTLQKEKKTVSRQAGPTSHSTTTSNRSNYRANIERKTKAMNSRDIDKQTQRAMIERNYREKTNYAGHDNMPPSSTFLSEANSATQSMANKKNRRY